MHLLALNQFEDDSDEEADDESLRDFSPSLTNEAKELEIPVQSTNELRELGMPVQSSSERKELMNEAKQLEIPVQSTNELKELGMPVQRKTAGRGVQPWNRRNSDASSIASLDFRFLGSGFTFAYVLICMLDRLD